MVHLNELKEKYGEKGLVVVGASAEGRSSVEDFIEEFEVKYPTITAKVASLEPFRSGGVPLGFPGVPVRPAKSQSLYCAGQASPAALPVRWLGAGHGAQGTERLWRVTVTAPC